LGPHTKTGKQEEENLLSLLFRFEGRFSILCQKKKKMGNDRKDKGRIKIEAKSILGDDRKDRRGYFSYS